MNAPAETITLREFRPLFEERHGPGSRSLGGQFLRTRKARIVGKAGRELLFDRAEVMKLLLASYPQTKQARDAQLEQARQAALQRVYSPQASLAAPLPPPLPDPRLAKVNLASWAVAAHFRMVQDLKRCPAHLADERKTQACLFTNFLRNGIAPCLAGLTYDGQDGQAMAQKLADELRRYATGQSHQPPESPDWLTNAQGKITLLAASVGMNPELFDSVTPQNAASILAGLTA